MRAAGFITVVIPFRAEDGGAKVEQLLRGETAPGEGNHPQQPWADALGQAPRLIHFLSLTVIAPKAPMDPEPPATRGDVALLVIEASSDTGTTETLGIVATRLRGLLLRLLWTARPDGWDPERMPSDETVTRFLIAHSCSIGADWGRSMGQLHDGSPAMTVQRIVDEGALAGSIAARIDHLRSRKAREWIDASPMQRVELLRDWLWDADRASQATKWAFTAEPAPVLQAAPPVGRLQTWKFYFSLGYTLVWPLQILLTLVLLEEFFIARKTMSWPPGWEPLAGSVLILLGVALLWWVRRPREYPYLSLVATTVAVIALMHSLLSAVAWLLAASTAIVIATWAVVQGAHTLLVRREKTDLVDDHAPDPGQVRDLMKVENFGPQNHMFTISTIKPGLIRWFALRAVLAGIGANPIISRPGFLGNNGVIHSARWMWIKDARLRWFRWFDPGRLIFWSNFDGTWDSYVGDFVADSPDGVTGLWSNCNGFPRANKLIYDGATNRDRLVRWARRQQVPTPFWYSAYPDLTNARIRSNAAIRQGIACATTDADARDWLSLFGSQPRPRASLITSQIPTLVFGGLSSLPYATCYMIRLSDIRHEAQDWLRHVAMDVTFGELLPGQTRAVTLALSVGALRKLHLPDNAISTFPVPFQQGMWTPERARALGDEHGNDPSTWLWGSDRITKRGTTVDETADAYLVIYGRCLHEVADEETHLLDAGMPGWELIHSQPLAYPGDDAPPADGAPCAGVGCGRRATKAPLRTEHFGFVDGLSQPVIRGLRSVEESTAKDDLVGPGEFVLGYPDSLPRIPPTPLLDAKDDPDHLLADEESDVPPDAQRPEFSRYRANGRRDLGMNGTFLVVRHLQQHVDRWEDLLKRTSQQVFDNYITSAADGGAAIVWGDRMTELVRTGNARAHQVVARTTYARATTPAELEPVIAAKLIGRWKNGSPLVRCPVVPGDAATVADNSFRFGVEDPQGLACPLGAHIRRANPRDSRTAGSQAEIDSVNRHRLLRVGRPYTATDPGDGKPLERGLMFMCLNVDIERQFEFVQKSWVLNRNMSSLENEGDPLMGGGARSPMPYFSIPTPRGIVKVEIGKPLVTVRGGGYFFMPGLATLNFLVTFGSGRKHPPPSGGDGTARPGRAPYAAGR